MYTTEFAKEIAKHMNKKVSDLPRLAEGVAKMLRADATNYQLYGAYWWAIKKLLKQHIKTNDWFVGDYMDDMTYQRAWHDTELITVSAGVNYQLEQIMITPSHSVIIDDTIQSYTLYDEDAGF